MQIRGLKTEDRDRLVEIIGSTANFNAADIAIAIELIDDAISKQSASDYIVEVLEDDSGTVQAYVCFGKTPLTESTFDFYWMVIDSQYQRRGMGYLLFQHVEERVRTMGGKLLMCETSSLDGYERVVRLYEKLGYSFVARIKNFYRDGDDKLIYMKEL
jgi:ribosomal protein S18 acetylase RimI-like enzyme